MGTTLSSRTKYEEIELGQGSAIDFNKADGTRLACLGGLTFSYCAGLAVLIVGAIFAKGSETTFTLNPIALELIPLAINVCVTALTESLGYSHMVSLRWALFHENRLEFNANLRLLTFSKTNWANSIFANALFFLALAICYASSPMILVQNTMEYGRTDGAVPWAKVSALASLSKVTPIIFGAAVLVLCMLSTWSLQTTKIMTWSSNPFDTLAAGISSGAIHHRDGRAMMSVHDRRAEAVAKSPRVRQDRLVSVTKTVPRVLFSVLIVLGALIVWMSIIVYLGLKLDDGMQDAGAGNSWSIIPTATNYQDPQANQTLTVFLRFFSPSTVNGNVDGLGETGMAAALFFIVLIQSFITIGLHCAELQITLLRDEQVWREMVAKGGSVSLDTYNSLARPFTSWPNVVLLAFKPVIHWMFGSAMGIDYAVGIVMRVPHVTYLAVLWAIFLAFMLQVSFSRSKGPLPAAYGHLQTMADIVDEWAPRMFWGDKGEIEGLDMVKHAGTAGAPLPAVEMGTLYS